MQFLQSGRALLWLGIGFLELGLCISTARVLLKQDFDRVDSALMRSFGAIRSPWLIAAAADLTSLGSFSVAAIISVVAITLLWRLQHRAAALQIVLSLLGATLVVHATKNIVQRPRPNEISPLIHASGFSDPSGHSLTAASVYLSLAMIVCQFIPTRGTRRAVMDLASVIISLVGLSRIYLGVHYPSDVATGLSFGAGWALLVASYFAFTMHGHLRGVAI